MIFSFFFSINYYENCYRYETATDNDEEEDAAEAADDTPAEKTE